MVQDVKKRLIERSGNKCELCKGKLEVAYSLLRKGTIHEDDPLYSMLGLCKECAAKLKKGEKVQTSLSAKLVISNNKNGSHNVKVVKGAIPNSTIKNSIKGDYTIEGPFILTDVITKSKISYFLGGK